MKRFFTTLSLLLLFPIFAKQASAQGTFLCQCVAGDGAGGCAVWEANPSQTNCSNDPPSSPVANAATCGANPVCAAGGETGECIVECTPNSQQIPVGYGQFCDPNNPNIVCRSDPLEPTAPTTCRLSESANANRCLKLANSLGEDARCRDHSECFGYSSGARCVFPPGISSYQVCRASITGNPNEICETRPNGIIICRNPTSTSTNTNGTGGTGPNSTSSNTAEEVQCENRPGTVDTAIGCINFNNINLTVAFFLRWASGIAGGVALLLIALAGFRIATSQGNPQRLQGGQELLLSAIGGLLMVVLSVYLLRFIGVDLLGIF